MIYSVGYISTRGRMEIVEVAIEVSVDQCFTKIAMEISEESPLMMPPPMDAPSSSRSQKNNKKDSPLQSK